jgi:LDH2 family malate/lactate/ureidoglycolate dehydrogenase
MAVVEADALQQLLDRIYQAHGVAPAEAEVVSRHQVGANLAGHDSHGVMQTTRSVAAVESGAIAPTGASDSS